MDRAILFARQSVADAVPFFMVVWFHAPHLPTVAGPEQLEQYAAVAKAQHRHYYGCITALDEQVGRLRHELRELGSAENTMLWYCSDNGPAGKDGIAAGRTGGFRGRKNSLYEGGLRVPAMMEWPARVREPRVVQTACTTTDYLPTILSALEIEIEVLPSDGIDLGPVLAGDDGERERPIGFRHKGGLAWIEGDLKIVRKNGRAEVELYDLAADPFEKQNLATQRPDVLAAMRARLEVWVADCSSDGAR